MNPGGGGRRGPVATKPVLFVHSEPRGAFHESLRFAPEYSRHVVVKHDGRLEDCPAHECRALRAEVTRRALGGA